ncbi:molybdopterin molybdotransferase MoeA [Vulcanococcus limneticus Candia 3F8]|uniref:molybdopterin molybdotransferase MoeA n=1 Tax=Vulcanococcus limneticus TaxID=2170428 RepID=UPI000B9992A2|nr:molybdopterin molybdotransferase MoeA [Vulcanococcus limneticus]MCP9791317.1 molybdopterin molybdotransferase MoeA [Vulcanococcus limneticus MW73D5]MCP9893347.1 molybdopterin molybdotransferase MoeA [Vulcanococcus limneticus Candia 3F8]MCP9896636.1 molybdopterin molybdotransferase MoeA [Vulcanococcus limneticus Candia 3B3]
MANPARSSEPFPAEGLPLEQARQRILEAIAAPGAAERLPLASALGRVSAEPVRAPAAVPGFRAAILDGYAIAEASVPQLGHTWPVVGRSAPGAPFRRAGGPGAGPDRLEPGEAIRILTGAPLPEGATRVLAQELVVVEGGAADRPATASPIRLAREASANPWIRAAEEEATAGQELLPAGVRLGPADLGRLAGCGVAELALRPRPRIGLLVSGDELVPAGQPRGPGQIWESNGTLLEALLARLGYAVAERRLVGDAPETLRAALLELAGGCDVVVSTGGVSAGDSDWIRPLLAELGAVDFWKLFLKPGRPFAFGELGGRPFFGLPGNPVAAAITALQLLWPALQALEGAEPQLLPRLKLRLAADLKRGPGRPELARARLQVGPGGELLALVEGSQASSRIGSLQGADLLLEIPAEAGTLAAGSELWAQLLRLPLF